MKKCISFLLALCLTLTMTAIVLPQKAVAASNDILGLDSGTVYYIRNVATGAYLDVQSGTTNVNVWGQDYASKQNGRSTAIRTAVIRSYLKVQRIWRWT